MLRDTRLARIERLYERDFVAFVRVARGIVGDRERALEAVNDGFVDAIKARAALRNEAALEAWVWRIVINEAVALRRQSPGELEWDAESATAASTNGVPEQDAVVRAWVAALPERQRLAIFLRYFADLDYRSIATALEVEVGTVSATLGAAHAALRRSFQEVAP